MPGDAPVLRAGSNRHRVLSALEPTLDGRNLLAIGAAVSLPAGSIMVALRDLRGRGLVGRTVRHGRWHCTDTGRAALKALETQC